MLFQLLPINLLAFQIGNEPDGFGRWTGEVRPASPLSPFCAKVEQKIAEKAFDWHSTQHYCCVGDFGPRPIHLPPGVHLDRHEASVEQHCPATRARENAECLFQAAHTSASLQRIQQVARAIGVGVRKELLMPLAPTNFNALLTKLAQAGLDNDFLTSKLLPTTDIARLDGSAGPADEARLIAHTADVASRVFGWTKKELFAPAALAPPRYAAAEARFKIPARRRRRATNLYAAYANYLAVVVLKACEALPRSPIPADVDAFRAALLGRYGTINLRNTVCFAWDLGVPVLPLRDRGTFHGACWRYGFRNVVVLKQNSRHLSRWLFDLPHELFHASQHPEQETLEVIEADATALERTNSEEEIAASQFAGDILLEGRAEEIAQASVDQARGSVERLKGVVPDVARRFGVDTGALANYLAFRLSWQNINWWGAAANLQQDDENPWQVARDVFLERFSFDVLSDLDRQLLQRALH